MSSWLPNRPLKTRLAVVVVMVVLYFVNIGYLRLFVSATGNSPHPHTISVSPAPLLGSPNHAAHGGGHRYSSAHAGGGLRVGRSRYWIRNVHAGILNWVLI